MKAAFIFSQFPRYDEAFLLREVKALHDLGVELKILSLRRCRDRIIHEDAKGLVPLATYLPWVLSIEVWMSTVQWLIKKPWTVLGLLRVVLAGTLRAPWQTLKNLLVMPKAMAFAKRMREEKIQLVHACWATFPATAARVVSELLGVPWTLAAHAHDIYTANPLLKENLRAARLSMTCTEVNREHLTRLVPDATDKIFTVHHGLDLNRYSPRANFRSEDTFHIVAVGSLFACKGYPALLDVLHRLCKRGREARLRVVGDGPERAALEEKARSLGIRDRVEFAGYVTQGEMPSHYQWADAFVLMAVPQIHWGIPNVVIEAMASGLPVVVTQLPSLELEFSERDVGAYLPLSSEAERIDAAVESLNQLAKSRERREKIGERARRKVERLFDITRCAAVMKRHLEKAAGIQPEQEASGVSEEEDASRQASAAEGQPQGVVAVVSGGPPEQAQPLAVDLTPIPVMHLIWALTPGGAERQAVEIAKGFHGHGCSVTMVCLTRQGALADELTPLGIEVICLNKKSGLDWSVVTRLTELLKERSTKVLHAHMFTASLWGRIAARRAKVPVVITHEHSTHTLDAWWRRTLDCLLLGWEEKVVTVSRALEEQFRDAGYPSEKLMTIPNGLRLEGWERPSSQDEVREKLGIQADAIVVVAVGSLEPRKDHAGLLKAMAGLSGLLQEEARPILLLVGDGPLRQELEEEASALSSKVEVRFMGEQQDVRDFLWAADVYVCSSFTEGTSIALLEAIAAGTPVVATAVGGNPEVLDEGKAGLLVPERDHAALAKALHDALASSAAADERAALARERVHQEYSRKAMLERFAHLYVACLKEKASP